jgi:23S rRNA pseudouridine1911/1915/1917 synthase
MVVHPGAGSHKDTLVNALLHHCKSLSAIGGVKRPGIVHRLDKNTSGLLIAAKNDFAHNALSRQLKERRIKRNYWALVFGSMPDEQAVINAPITRSRRNRKKMTVSPLEGKSAITHYKVLRKFNEISLVEAMLQTGRTHQIRVHFAHVGRPVVGDPDYGGKATPYLRRIKQRYPQIAQSLAKVKRQLLHSKKLIFQHPRTSKEMVFEIPLPQDFDELLKALEQFPR